MQSLVDRRDSLEVVSNRLIYLFIFKMFNEVSYYRMEFALRLQVLPSAGRNRVENRSAGCNYIY